MMRARNRPGAPPRPSKINVTMPETVLKYFAHLDEQAQTEVAVEIRRDLR